MHYIMVFACKWNWRSVVVPVPGGQEALRRFKPVRMTVSQCPQCGSEHVYRLTEGVLKVWDGQQIRDPGRVA
jgi:hypothetical protein